MPLFGLPTRKCPSCGTGLAEYWSGACYACGGVAAEPHPLPRRMKGLWSGAVRWLWTQALREPFRRGKVSFGEGRIEGAIQEASPIEDISGAQVGTRLVAHARVSAGHPRDGSWLTGEEGWSAFREHLRSPGYWDRFVLFGCAHCRHVFLLQLRGAEDPLPPPRTPGEARGTVVSYDSPWFGFPAKGCPGTSRLDCPHCSREGTPSVRFVWRFWG